MSPLAATRFGSDSILVCRDRDLRTRDARTQGIERIEQAAFKGNAVGQGDDGVNTFVEQAFESEELSVAQWTVSVQMSIDFGFPRSEATISSKTASSCGSNAA